MSIAPLVAYEVRFGTEVVPYLAGYECSDAISEALNNRLPEHGSVYMLADVHVREHARVIFDMVAEHRRVVLEFVDASERYKRLDLVGSLVDRAVEVGMDRRSSVVAMGGGVLGNIAGMVAALLYRGVPLIHLPTTPVAAFDSVLSAKQAVNLRWGKNMCGTFLTPTLVLCDLAWLRTVTRDQLLTGAAEMVKNVLAVRPDDADQLVTALDELWDRPEHALLRLLDVGISAKAPFLALDPREKHEALIFEYGHTIGHAFEFASEGRMSHGEAVAWGMLVAADVSNEVAGLPSRDVERHRELVSALRLPRARLSGIPKGQILPLLLKDNKRGYLATRSDESLMVLLERLGQPLQQGHLPLVSVTHRVISKAVDTLLPR